jgi:hypothetical protein
MNLRREPSSSPQEGFAPPQPRTPGIRPRSRSAAEVARSWRGISGVCVVCADCGRVGVGAAVSALPCALAVGGACGGCVRVYVSVDCDSTGVVLSERFGHVQLSAASPGLGERGNWLSSRHLPKTHRQESISPVFLQLLVNDRVHIFMDLDEVTLVDVEVVRFLSECEDRGIVLVHCLPYVREWILRERHEGA